MAFASSFTLLSTPMVTRPATPAWTGIPFRQPRQQSVPMRIVQSAACAPAAYKRTKVQPRTPHMCGSSAMVVVAAAATAMAGGFKGGLRGTPAGRRTRDSNQIVVRDDGEYVQPRRRPGNLKKYKHIPQSRLSEYRPGEGYGSNVIPFSGVSLPRGEYGRHMAQQYIERANEIGGQIIDGQEANFEQKIPVPLERLQARDDPLHSVLDDAQSAGVEVRLVTDEATDAHGFTFGMVELAGDNGPVADCVFKLMACLVPKQIAAASAS